MKRLIVLLRVCLYYKRDCCDINGFIRRFPLFCLYERLSLGGSFAEPPSSKETLDVYRIISIDHVVSRRQRHHRRPLGHLFKMPDRESSFSCRDCHGVNSRGGGLCLKRWKIIGKASESVDGKNEVKDGGERVQGSKRHGREEGRRRRRERERDR